MKVDILDIDQLILVNKLQEVTTSKIRSNKLQFDPDGLLSNEIFGISKDDRRNTFAFIRLQMHFIHPHIYSKVLKMMYRNVMSYILSGRKRYSVVDGELREDPDGWTGIQGFYDHYDEIDWSKHKSSNKLNKDLMVQLPKEKVFIDKLLICPPAYRDVILSGTVDSSDYVNELNKLYQQVINLTHNLASGGLFKRTQYSSQDKIQDTLVDIMLYFRKLISKKYGLIRQNLMGKSVDFGSRAVISSNNYNNETFEDSMVDSEHCALPISQCCSNFYPLIEAYMKNFLTREIINDPNNVSFYDPILRKNITATVHDPEIQFSEKNIKKMINSYCMNPDHRFKPISFKVDIPTEKGTKQGNVSLKLTGKIITENNVSKELDRVMTLTDLMYIACVDVCEKRHIMVSRYPVGTDKGIFFNRIRVQSTSDHVHVIFNGRDYPYYPKIDIDLDTDKVGIQFIDTLVMSNSHLDGMGADFDGDVLSIRGIWSDEANDEAEGLMYNKMTALDISGKNSKVVSKEVVNSTFELTKIGDKPRVLSADEANKILSVSYKDMTKSVIAEWFADFVDNSSGNKNVGKRKSKYNTWDEITIPENYFYPGQSKTKTTIGRYVVNRFILERSGVIAKTGFVNDVLNKKGLGKLDDQIGHLYMKDEIDRTQFNLYTDARDCLGYWANGMLAHTISERMLKPLPEIEKKKAELFKKYEKDLESGNIDIMTKISNELINYAKEVLKGDPGMDLYDSGDLDFGNNYRNNAILRGAVANKLTDSFDFIGTSLMDGIQVKDIPTHANTILSSQFPASIATEDAGYLGKKLLALLQMLQIDEDGTDCGTKNLIPITITNYNADRMVYTYIDNGSGQLIMLDEDNVKSYVGKRVKMRSPMSCTSEKICSKCAGKLFYYLGIKNAGLFGVQISHADLNLALKAKHNSVVDIYPIDPDTIIKDIT